MKTNEQNTQKHTPGPWQANGLGIAAKRSYNTEFYGRLRDFRNPIADVLGNPMQDEAELEDCVDGTGRFTGVTFRVPGCHEAEANARLIAAAPELLEALRKVTLEASHFLHGKRDNGTFLENELKNALAAIAKATGEGKQ